MVCRAVVHGAVCAVLLCGAVGHGVVGWVVVVCWAMVCWVVGSGAVACRAVTIWMEVVGAVGCGAVGCWAVGSWYAGHGALWGCGVRGLGGLDPSRTHRMRVTHIYRGCSESLKGVGLSRIPCMTSTLV